MLNIDCQQNKKRKKLLVMVDECILETHVTITSAAFLLGPQTEQLPEIYLQWFSFAVFFP